MPGELFFPPCDVNYSSRRDGARQPRQPRPAKPPKIGGQIVTDGGAHAPTRTRGRRRDLCGGSSELGGDGDGRLGFVTDASRGTIFGFGRDPGAFPATICEQLVAAGLM